jgi:hypothetical protein
VATAQGAELTWDRGGGAPAAELRGHGGPVGALAFLSTDRRTLLASASAVDVLLWLGPRRGEGGGAAGGGPPSYRCVGLLSPTADGPARHVALHCAGGGGDVDVWFSAAVGREIAVGAVPGSLLSGGGGAVRPHCQLAGHAAAVSRAFRGARPPGDRSGPPLSPPLPPFDPEIDIPLIWALTIRVAPVDAHAVAPD